MKKKLLQYLDKEFKIMLKLKNRSESINLNADYYQGRMELIDEILRFINDNPY